MNRLLANYEELLETRNRAERRNAVITRWAFLLSLIGYIAFGMLGQLRGLSLFVGSVFPIAFGAGYFTAWARSNTTSELMQLVDTLERSFEEE